MGRVLGSTTRNFCRFMEKQAIRKQAIIANLYFGAQVRDIVNHSIGLEFKVKLTTIHVNAETHEALGHVNGM